MNLLFISFLITLAKAQIGQSSFKSCIDDNYEYREDLDACVPECKIGESLDEDYYCIEIIFLKA